MSRCSQTDALLDAAFAGGDLTRSEADHVRACSECARALSLARRLDTELSCIGIELTTDPVPPAADLIAAPAAGAEEARSMTLRRGLLTGGVAAVLLAVSVFAGGQWLGSALGQLQPGVSAAELDAWVDHALRDIAVDVGADAEDEAWIPIQVEVCGESALAVFGVTDPGGASGGYWWVLGEPTEATVVDASGHARTITGADLATVRAGLPVCSVVVDAGLDPAAAFAAFGQARELYAERHGVSQPVIGIPDVRSFEVLDFSRMDPEHYAALLQRPGTAVVDRLTMSLTDDGGFAFGDWRFSGDFQPSSNILYRDLMTDPPMYYAFVPEGDVAAVDIIGPETTLRYAVAAPGFVVQVDVRADLVTAFQFLDAEGAVIAHGDIVDWPPVDMAPRE